MINIVYFNIFLSAYEVYFFFFYIFGHLLKVKATREKIRLPKSLKILIQN